MVMFRTLDKLYGLGPLPAKVLRIFSSESLAAGWADRSARSISFRVLQGEEVVAGNHRQLSPGAPACQQKACDPVLE